jgi:hypothetical protein
MATVEQSTACPPHHWEILSHEQGKVVHDFHRCMRCGEEKDVPRKVGGDLTMPRPRRGGAGQPGGIRYGRGAAAA